MIREKKVQVVLAVILILIGFLVLSLKPDHQVDFSTEVKPILNKHCISCHGGVKKNSGFSVLFESEAMGVTESGNPAIIPGSARRSELIQRLHYTDPELRMPYQKTPLSADEIKTLTDWIDQGAQWGSHWAYLPVEKTELPEVAKFFEEKDFIVNPIDHFIAARMEEKDLLPNSPAPKNIIARRLAFDITGLPLIQLFFKVLSAERSPTKTMLTTYLTLVPMVKNGLVGGWIWPDMPIPWDLKKIREELFGIIGIGSSRH